MNKTFSVLWILALCIFISACGTPEEKKMKFFNKGKTFYEKGDYTKARLEFKNAAQIDPKFADARYMLGMTDLKDRKIKSAFAGFSQAAALDPDHIDARIQLARIYFAAKAIDKAKENIAAVLEKSPENQDALLMKSIILLAENDPDASIGILHDLQKKGDNSPELYMTMAKAMIAEKDLKSAENALKEGISNNPESVSLNIYLARLYGGTGRLADTEKVLRNIINIDPDNVSHRLNLASLYWDTNQREKADSVIDNIVKLNPESEDTRIKTALFYMSKKDSKKATELLESSLESFPESFDIRFALSEIYINAKENKKCEDILKKCLTLDKDPSNPDIIKTKTALAKFYFAGRDIDKSSALVDDILDKDPKNIDAHFIKGKICLVKNDGISAVSHFRTVVNEKPSFVPAQIGLAKAHLANKETGLALDTLKSASAAIPDSTEIRRMLAHVYLIKKEYANAEKCLRDNVSLKPDDLRAIADLGDFLAASGKLDEAAGQYETLKMTAPKNPVGYLKMAQLYEKKKEPEKAEKEIKAACRIAPESPQLFARLVRFYILNGRYDDALSACRERINKNPDDALALNMSGRIYALKKEYGKAEKAFAKAGEIMPMWPEPHNNIAGIYLARGMKDEAVEKFESALDKNPKNAPAYLSLGHIYEQGGEYEKAEAIYEKAISVTPGFWSAINNLACLYSDNLQSEENYKKALSLAEKAEKINPGEPMIQDTLGWAYYRNGNLDSAEKWIRKALSKSPDAPVLNYHMGMVLLKSGNTVEAKEKLSLAVKSDTRFQGREDAEKALSAI